MSPVFAYADTVEPCVSWLPRTWHDTEARRRTLTFHHRSGSGLRELRGIGTSERKRAALAVVADGGFDTGRGRRRRLVNLPVLAAVPGEHAERQPHLRLGLRRSRFLRRVFAAHGRRAGAVGVRAEHRCDGARRSGLANPRSRDAVAAEDQGRRGTFRPGHTCPRQSHGDRRCGTR